MYVEQLFLTNFRNYGELSLEPHKGMNIILGQNAQGKSNLLEALFLFTAGKSFRAIREKEIVKWGETYTRVSTNIVYRHEEKRKIEFFLQLNNKSNKIIKINNKIARTASELAGNFNAVLFSPDDIEIIKGSPGIRRRFIDLLITQISPNYCSNISNYYRVLEQRNSLLRSRHTGEEEKIKSLDIWDEQLAEYGTIIIMERLNTIKSLNNLAKPVINNISKEKEILEIKYSCPLISEKYDIKELFKKSLYTMRIQEIARGITSTGPHRDDLSIYINGKPLKNYGSQGQKRTVALALKLAERELIYEKTGEEPLLLLDDITSELDEERCIKLLNYTTDKGQIFLTQSQNTDFLKPFYKKALFMHVEGGKVNSGLLN